MNVDLTDKEERGSFDLKGGGKVHLRLRTDQDEKEIRAACVTSVVEFPLLDGKHQRFETEKTDTEQYVEMAWDKNIVGWDEIYDVNKKPVPITKENNVLLMKLVPTFNKAVADGLKALKEASTDRAEQAEKN